MDAARERRRGRQAGRRVRPARRRLAAGRGPGGEYDNVVQRRGPGRARVPRRRSTTCRPRKASGTASSPGTRSSSTRAPGSSTSRRAPAPRTSSSRACTACRCSAPIDECGRFLPGVRAVRGADDRRGRGADHRARCDERRRAGRGRDDRPPLPDLLALQDAARLPRRRRLVHRRRRDPRQPLLDENHEVEWTPPQYGKRMDDWLRNMGDWNISRKRYFGLPLPFYPCACGHLNVIGSRAELEERAVARARPAAGAAPPVDRRGADPLRVVRRRGAADPGGRRRLARRGHRPASRRSAGRTRSGSSTATRPARRRA